MTLIAYDSARPSLIPASAAAVLPYSDGKYRWSNERFPRARWRYITVLGDPKADIADVEPGCIWPPAMVLPWARARLRLGITDLTVYTDRDNYPAVDAALAGYGWHLFLATLDGSKPTTYLGRRCRAVQFTDQQGAFDMSLVYDQGWLNAPPAPAAAQFRAAVTLTERTAPMTNLFDRLRADVEGAFEKHAGELETVTGEAASVVGGPLATAEAAALHIPAFVPRILADALSQLDAEFGRLAEHIAAAMPAAPPAPAAEPAPAPAAEPAPAEPAAGPTGVAAAAPGAQAAAASPAPGETASGAPGIAWPAQ